MSVLEQTSRNTKQFVYNNECFQPACSSIAMERVRMCWVGDTGGKEKAVDFAVFWQLNQPGCWRSSVRKKP